MRGVGAIALCIGVAAAGASAASTDSAALRPGLRVSNLAPLTVRGYRFDGAERLRVVITTKRRFVRRVEANANGRFSLVLRHISIGRCAPYSVRAYGSNGLRAAVKSPPKMCGAEVGPL
jgi:hypothetical protein